MDLEMNEITKEEPDNIIYLSDEEGRQTAFEFLDLVTYEGDEYVVLLPADDAAAEEETAEAVILRIEELNDQEDSYVGVEDQAVLDAVFSIFKDEYSDIFNFVD